MDNKAPNSTIEVETVITNGKVLLGSCDTVYLVFYATGLFFSGHIADNTSLRVFLCIGMLGSGLFVAMIGLAHVFQIHSLWYFYVCYAIQGLFQATGWPAVVAVMGNWFGKSTRSPHTTHHTRVILSNERLRLENRNWTKECASEE